MTTWWALLLTQPCPACNVEVWSLLWWISTCYACQRGHSKVRLEGWGRKACSFLSFHRYSCTEHFSPLQWHPNPCSPCLEQAQHASTGCNSQSTFSETALCCLLSKYWIFMNSDSKLCQAGMLVCESGWMLKICKSRTTLRWQYSWSESWYTVDNLISASVVWDDWYSLASHLALGWAERWTYCVD